MSWNPSNQELKEEGEPDDRPDRRLKLAKRSSLVMLARTVVGGRWEQKPSSRDDGWGVTEGTMTLLAHSTKGRI